MMLHAELAWLPGGLVRDVLIDISGDRFVSVTPSAAKPPDARRLPGITFPGLANAHSHAFHRALRGRVQAGRGSFWTWRRTMYEVAGRLDPSSYFALARAVYAEMALAGITCVGEFHYVHHAPGGVPYEDPNAMGAALIAAAAEAGIRITLLDTCYLAGGIGEPLSADQARFGDGTAEGWAVRASALKAQEHARIGAALHSVRAVPAAEIPVVAQWAAAREAPLHVHLSEQPAENEACLAAYGVTPAGLLADEGSLGPRTVAVHATHLSPGDISVLGATGTGVCMCPTTERDLADGIGPVRAVGTPMSLGTDQHAMIDMFEEARAVELDERLRTGERGHWSAPELLAAASVDGHAALGWPAAGRIEPGSLADLVTVGLDSVRLAGAGGAHALESVVFAASAADVRQVFASGKEIVRDGRHLLIDDVPRALSAAITTVTP